MTLTESIDQDRRIGGAPVLMPGHQAAIDLLSFQIGDDQVANRVSTHREAVSRELGRLADAALISKEGRGLRILDVPALREIAAFLRWSCSRR